MKTFVRAFIMTVTYFLPLFLLSTVVSGETVTSYLLAGVLTVLAYLGLVWLYLTFWDKKPWSVMKLRVDHQAIKGFVLAASWTVIIVVASCVGAIFLGDVDKSAASWSVANLVKAFVSAFLIQGFPEELVFRGYIFQTLHLKPAHKMLASAALFAAIHLVHLTSGWGFGLLTTAMAFSFGLFAAILRDRYQTTWAAVAVHGGIHMTRKMFELAGYGFGNSHFMLAGTGFLLCSIYLLWRWYRPVADV